MSSHVEGIAESSSGASSSLNPLVGILYSYGAGDPSTPFGETAKGKHGGYGLDCSGFAQVALVHLGKLDARAPDRSAAGLASLSKRIPWGSQRFGDLAFYGKAESAISHVMVVNEDARADGDSELIGASGGYPTTNGDNPNARIKTFHTAKYRKGDFRFFGRIGE